VRIPWVGDGSDKSLSGNGLTVDSRDGLLDLVKLPRAAGCARMRILTGGMVGIIGKFSRWRRFFIDSPISV
jgi:hypothetical protein